MTRQLVLIGGGHAHMVTLDRLETFVGRGFGVTVIQPSPYHYYSGMGPGMLGGTYNPEEIRFATQKQVEDKGGRFLLGKAERIDTERQLVILDGTKEEIPYDVLSCNAGSYVPRQMIDGDGENIFTAKPIEALLLAQKRIATLAGAGELTVAVAGSGPSALELAGNILQYCRKSGGASVRLQLFCGRSFMSGKPARVRRLARSILLRKGVEIIEKGYVRKIANGQLLLEGGESYQSDIVFAATGVRPSQIFARSKLPVGEDGGLLVNEFLQAKGYANIFGGGDCICFEPRPLDKVGVYAVRQNMVLYENLLASLEGKELKQFSPGGSYLLIYNLGDGEGLFSKWCFTFSGRLAFRIKDLIDRRFIRTFQ